jgi:cold shock CspA family protein
MTAYTGTCIFYIEEPKGFGFLRPDGDPVADVFFHVSRIIKGYPGKGARARFGLELDPKKGKPMSGEHRVSVRCFSISP